MRKRRDEISEEIERTTPKKEIEYYKKKAAEFHKQDN